MQFGRLPRKTLLAATLCLAFSAANAAFLEQTGTPAAPPVVMKTYGVDVSTRIGLKAVIPAGWQLFVHRSVTLPESLSWKVDESWVSVLNNFSVANDVAVLVDWDKKAVYFRSTEVALQEQEKRQIITQAAATPLPSFKADEPAKSTKAEEPPGAIASVPVAAVAVPEAAPKPVELAVTPVAQAVEAIAQGAVAVVAPAVADAVVTALPVTSAVATPVVVPPPVVAPRVTSLDGLLDAATKPVLAVVPAPAAPVEKAVSAPIVPPAASAPAKIAVVLPALVAPTVTPPIEAPAPAVRIATEATAPVAAVTTAVAPAVFGPLPDVAATVVTTAAAAYAEQPLVERPIGEAFNRKAVDEVIRSAAEKNGYLVSWEAADVQFPGPVTILGADMGEDMRLVLRALGGRRSPVSIDVYRASSIVRVRNASGAAEVAFKDEPFSGAIREKSVSTFTAKVVPEVVAPRIIAVPPAPAQPSLTVARAPAPVLVAVPPVAAPEVVPAVVVAEPERVATAVDSIKKLGPSLTEQQIAAKPTSSHGEVELQAPAKSVQAAVVLRVEPGESLRTAIEAVLDKDWTLKWQVNGDMEANTRLEVGGESIAAILNKVLPRLSLSADIYKPSKLIVIRPADAALDK